MKKNVPIIVLLVLFVTGCGAPTSMVRIEGGTFAMGSPSAEPDRSIDELQHQVTVGSFYIGKYPVTQKEYHAVMKTNPSEFKEPKHPVENVSWYNAIDYCNKRSQKEGLIPAYMTDGTGIILNKDATGYRLPTEAEWEYACRAGTTTAYNTGSAINDATGWYDANSGDKPHPVGLKPPNAWGLYDMHGNVAEWCWDWYGYYSNEAQTDPTGAVSGEYRVFRGGSWGGTAQAARSAFRGVFPPLFGNSLTGFRVVRP